MADATTDVYTDRSGLIPAQSSLGCAANVILLAGTIATADSSGYADVPTNGQHAVGIVDATFDNRTTAPEGGGAGAVIAEISHGVFTLAYTGTAPVVNAETKTVMYVVDNQTVSTDSNSGVRGIAGVAVDVIDATYCKVLINPFLSATLAAVMSAQADLDTAEASLAALELEVGDYTGGGGAEADVATGVTQAETDISALEADVTSTDNQWDLGLQKAVLAATGAPLIVFNDGVADGWDLVGSELIAYRFNPSSTGAIALAGVLPSDLDPSADLVLHFVGAREGADDITTVLTCTMFFHSAGAAYTADDNAGGSSSAFDGATTVVTDETLTIAAANIPAASTAFTLTIVPDAALDADDLLLIAVYGKYTGVALT